LNNWAQIKMLPNTSSIRLANRYAYQKKKEKEEEEEDEEEEELKTGLRLFQRNKMSFKNLPLMFCLSLGYHAYPRDF